MEAIWSFGQISVIVMLQAIGPKCGQVYFTGKVLAELTSGMDTNLRHLLSALNAFYVYKITLDVK